jgi:peroxiredoxin
MSLIKLYIVLFFCLVVGDNYLEAQLANDSVFQPAKIQGFRLMDPARQKITSLKNVTPGNQLLLFIFLSPECPICKNYTQALNALQQQYGKTVTMTGIIPGRTYSNAIVNAFAQKHKTAFSLLIDTKKEISNYLNASITPEVVLLNSRGELVYRGAIDNSIKQLGGPKSRQATENYLEEAINKYLQHGSIAVKRVKAVGCLINDF